MRKLKGPLSVLLPAFVFILSFQNCGRVAFSMSDTGAVAIEPQSGGLQPAPALVPVKVFACTQFIELPRSASINVPARTDDGLCYAVKITDAVPSRTTANHDPDLISRVHGANNARFDPTVTGHPFDMALYSGEVLVSGARTMHISSVANAVHPISVDNFILMGMQASAPAGVIDTQNYSVIGTQDISIADAQGNDAHAISFRSTMLPVQSTSADGTMNIDYSKSLEAQGDYTIDFRAVDAGGTGLVTDVYLVFE